MRHRHQRGGPTQDRFVPCEEADQACSRCSSRIGISRTRTPVA
jgi:hypothetical protein